MFERSLFQARPGRRASRYLALDDPTIPFQRSKTIHRSEQSLPLYCMAEVREITFGPASSARSVIISPVMPSPRRKKWLRLSVRPSSAQISSLRAAAIACCFGGKSQNRVGPITSSWLCQATGSGALRFAGSGERSGSPTPIAVSDIGEKQEAMLLTKAFSCSPTVAKLLKR
jgi:hypothetical protein